MSATPTSGRGLLSRKPVEAALADLQASGFRRALGLVDLTAIGVAGIIGAGIFVLLGQVAAGTGPAVVLSLVIGATAAALSALTFAELASVLPGSGSVYLYAYVALGRLPAFLIGWLVLNAYAVGNMVVSIGWSGLFADGLAQLGAPLPAALSAPPADGGVFNLPAAAIMVAVTLLTLPRIGESALVNNLLVALKLFIIVFVVGLGATLVQPRNWTPFSPGGFDGVMTGAAVLFFAYFGFDTIAAAGAEAKNPRRDLPIGILLSIGVCAVLYIAMGGVVTGIRPAATLDADNPVSSALADRGYAWAGGVVTAGALVALTTVLYAFQLALSRVLHAMALDGFLPRRLGRLHPATGTPWAVTLWTGGLTALGAGLLRLRSVADMAVDATIFVYVLVAGGVLALKALRPDLPRRFRAHWTAAAGGIVLMLVMAALGLPLFIHLVFAAWVGLGLVLYGFLAHRRPGA